MKLERVSYARILVVVDASKKLIDQVEFVMPNGITRKQPIAYEFPPKFCTECNRFGHLQETCQGTHPPAVAAAAAPATEWTMVQRRKKGKSTDVAAKGSGGSPTNSTGHQGGQDRRGVSPSIPMKIGFWNVRGFNRPLKHNGVAHLIKYNQLCLLGILETKLAASKIQTFLSRSFPGWCQANNFDTIAAGRILVIWNPAVIDIQPEDISPQVIHCRATNKSSQLSFYISFSYGLYSVVNRRSMWEKLTELGQTISIPWLIMGDFNYVKSPEEKQLGVTPTWYELKDFVDYCAALGLLDVPTTGCYYTWYSNNESNPMWCKLDRVLYNNEWLEAGLHCGAHFNPPGCLSDHSPGIVTIFDHTPTKPKPFRFFNMWAEHPDFLSTVEQRWNLNVEGTTQFILCKRLKALKAELKAFNTQHYSHISTRAKEADIALQDAQNQLENNPGNVTLWELGDLRRKAVFLAEAERHFFYQKAKIHYLKEGDRNTKFFHDMVKRNAARNSITAVTRADGTIITSADEIAQEFVDYYTSLLDTKSHTIPVDDGVFDCGPKLSSELIDELCREVTAVEVKDAIFNINDNKAPGPDGYSSYFFKKAWNVVGNQVCRAVLDFFQNGRMLRQLNHTVIAPVSKSEHSSSVADYRPISCCNIIYKAITKIISDRVAPALEHLIDRCQSAFIGGRNITDNIFLAQEMVR
ncbi:uncharacterized protein LOC105162752 [Sesamum indicum]|uniref:Uncharacterized protein LOC105162752 n=1 Tax=Sesamum indicum TaxID=4182 RepID=A0A6I9T5C5_SESIN|nr:uncharacterized protein LOC105162752 [Sesamum indicum]